MNVTGWKKKFLLLLWYLACTLNSKSLQAQKNGFPFPAFQNINTKHGLSNNSTYKLMQDSRGFIWIATNYGINRFDGYNYKVYNYDAADTNSLSSSWYRTLFEDKNGIIWIGSSTQGFFSFNPVTEKFKRYSHQPGNSNSLANNTTEGNIVCDSSGTFWMPTFSGLNSFDPVTEKFELYTHHNNDSTSLSANNIWWICPDENNNLWLMSTSNYVEVFSIALKKVIARYTIGSPQMPGDKNRPGLHSCSCGKKGNIWIGSAENGLYGYNTRTKKWKHYNRQPGNQNSLQSEGIQFVYEEDSGSMFIMPYENDIDYYQASSGNFFHANMGENNSPLENIVDIIKDNSGKIWMAGQYNGIYTIEPGIKKIIAVKHIPEKVNTLASDNIIGFYRTRSHTLFVYGDKGVYTYDTKNKIIRPFQLKEKSIDIFSKTVTWMVREDEKGLLWFCTLNGLISYNPVTKEYHRYQHNEQDTTSLSSSSATSIITDNNGKYWVTTFGGGIDLFNPETGKFKAFRMHSGKNSISSNATAFPLKDSKGNIYSGTWNGGLIRINSDNESFETFRHNPADSISISCDITLPLYESENGIIWVGTIGGGLNAFDPESGKFRAFTMNDGLPSNAVVSLVIDDERKTWLGTYHGISSCTLPLNPFDKNCKINFRNYDIGDGLPSNDLYLLGAHKEEDGSLFFATNSGFFYFNPREWKDNKFVPPVYITSFSLMNKAVSEKDSGTVLKVAIEFTKEILLTYKQNILSFTFAALNFIHPEKNKYAYMMEGYDKDWIYTDASKRFATYTNLDPGEYIFKVKGSNNDGLWNEKPTELKVFIAPPFWQTIWFKALVIAMVISATYMFYRYRIGQILLLQRIRNKIAADLHDDIGSTLNSISIFSEWARRDSAKRDHALMMIGESSRKIIDSMSDIVWSINPQNDSFDKIIFRMRSLTHNLMKAKKIECTFHSDESLHTIKLAMETRRNFYLIFKEALNNLVKYSQASRASVLVSHEHRSITFIVRDDGIGFDSTADYSGNGLINMKKRAEEIGAMLIIESVIGKGTSIELNLKV